MVRGFVLSELLDQASLSGVGVVERQVRPVQDVHLDDEHARRARLVLDSDNLRRSAGSLILRHHRVQCDRWIVEFEFEQRTKPIADSGISGVCVLERIQNVTGAWAVDDIDTDRCRGGHTSHLSRSR